MTVSSSDTFYMNMALRLAARGRGRTSPNPLVGAVIVRHGRVIGQGYHQRAGGPHAEILALRQAGGRAKDATLYVTLEPCCHMPKRTPPCVPALMEARLRRIVVAMRDPHPRVQGRGIQRLRRAGIQVDVGCLEQDARRLNEMYLHWVTTRCPFVMLKAAMTLDGQIATSAGESQWITGELARRHVHHVRSQVDAIMVGVGTVLRDDPQLSVRAESSVRRSGRKFQPVRVVLDTRLRVPETAKVLKWPVEQPTIIATTHEATQKKIQTLRGKGIEVWVLPQAGGRVSLRSCMKRLGRAGITSVLIEGGGELNAGAVRNGLVNKILLYTAPRLLGGDDAKGLIGGRAPKRLSEAIPVQDVVITSLGPDWLITGTLPAAGTRGRRGNSRRIKSTQGR